MVNFKVSSKTWLTVRFNLKSCQIGGGNSYLPTYSIGSLPQQCVCKEKKSQRKWRCELKGVSAPSRFLVSTSFAQDHVAPSIVDSSGIGAPSNISPGRAICDKFKLEKYKRQHSAGVSSKTLQKNLVKYKHGKTGNGNTNCNEEKIDDNLQLENDLFDHH